MPEKEPTIVRISKTDRTDYTMLSNAILQDKTMTYEARGMLCYLLSHPQDWDVRVKDLQQHCGKARVYRILKDLIEHRYVQRVAVRNDQNQFVEWIYTVSEEQHEAKRDDANPSEPEPLTDFPQLAEPQLENGDTYKGITSTKEELNKEQLFASPDGNAETVLAEIAKHPDMQRKLDYVLQDVLHVQSVDAALYGETVIEADALVTADEPKTMYDKPARPGNISDKQYDNLRPVYALGAAMGKIVADSDIGLYKREAKKLMDSGIAPAAFPDYVQAIRVVAQRQGGWDVTVTSLTTNGRITDYLSGKTEANIKPKSVTNPDAPMNVYDMMG